MCKCVLRLLCICDKYQNSTRWPNYFKVRGQLKKSSCTPEHNGNALYRVSLKMRESQTDRNRQR